MRMPKASYLTVLSGAGAIAGLVFFLLLVVEPYHSSKTIARALAEHSNASDLLAHEGPLEYSGGLPFYTGKKFYLLNGKQGDLDFGSRYSETEHLYLDDEKLARLWQSNQRVFLVTRLGRDHAFLKKVSSEKIFLIGRYERRWLYANKAVKSDPLGARIK